VSFWGGPEYQQLDPSHPAFARRKPLWLSVALGVVGLAVLLGFVVYVVVTA
jgi:hypothetical protein